MRERHFWVYWLLNYVIFYLNICVNIYILLDVLLCGIAEYFYELSKYKQRVKILSDTTQQNV